MQSALQHARALQLLGKETEGIAWQRRATSLLEVVAPICMQEEFEICRDEHLVHRIVRVRFALQKQADLLGLTETDINGVLLDSLVRACLKFEFDLTSTATVKSAPPGVDVTQTMEVMAITLGLKGTFAEWSSSPPITTGSGPLVSTDYDVTPNGNCVTVTATTPTNSLFYVVKFGLILGTGDDLGLKDFEFVYLPSPNLSSATISSGCTQPISIPVPLGWFPIESTIMNQKNPKSDALGGYPLSAWTVKAEAVMGRKAFAYTVTSGKATYEDDDVFVIRHTPAL